jgi:Phage integrase family
LRHSAATTLIEQGTNVRVVADLLGHSAVSFTLSTYVHPDEDAAAEAVERLGVARLGRIGGESFPHVHALAPWSQGETAGHGVCRYDAERALADS